jgi:hypothetical protein
MSIIYINPFQFAAAPPSGYDPDAQAYITAVETADGQALETGVRDAINAFVVGCKADGIWSAIKTSCILAGARTLNGAIVPLVGVAPTLVGSAGGWTYDRKNGITGNRTDNCIDSNRANNSDPQDSAHVTFYIGQLGTGSAFFDNKTITTSNTTYYDVATGGRGRINSSSSVPGVGIPTGGFVGFNRSASDAWQSRVNGTTTARTTSSSSTQSGTLIFQARRNATTGVPELLRDDAVSFYSIGESLDLDLLDARVSTLMSDFAAAIP